MKLQTSVCSVAIALCGFAFTASSHPSSGIVVDRQGNVYFSDLSRGLAAASAESGATVPSQRS
jgi:ABC-type sugar transport system substrate-binding protein